MNSPRRVPARHPQGTSDDNRLVYEKAVARGPKEVGAPASRIGVALGANALTPQDKDLYPVLGPGSHHHGHPYLIHVGAAGRGGRFFSGTFVSADELGPGSLR